MSAPVEEEDERTLPVLYVSPERFRARPQTGLRCLMTWPGLALYLGRPTIGDSKEIAGAWSPASYRNNVRRLDHLEVAHALVLDVDDCGHVERVAGLLEGHSAIVHSTFSSSPEAPRCRIVMELATGVDAAGYDRLHGIVRAHLAGVGIVADAAAKDASRLSFSPVVRADVVTSYRYRIILGAPLDVAKILAAHPDVPRVSAPPVACSGGRYARGALQRAAHAVASAPKGARNAALNREAYSLARLSDLPRDEIAASLLEAAVAAGLSRGEAVKTIASALRARGAA